MPPGDGNLANLLGFCWFSHWWLQTAFLSRRQKRPRGLRPRNSQKHPQRHIDYRSANLALEWNQRLKPRRIWIPRHF
jgi:hypothetical protein